MNRTRSAPWLPAALVGVGLLLGATACGPAGGEGEPADRSGAADTALAGNEPAGDAAAGDPGALDTTGAVSGGASAGSLPYALSGAHRRAVRSLLAERPGWRVAVPADNRSPLLDRQLENEPGYRPYVRAGEFTGDGREDLAIVLTDGSRFRAFLLRAVGEGFEPHPLGEANRWLAAGGLFVRDGHIGTGELFTDHLILYRWDASAEAMVPVERDPGELA